MDNDGNLNRDQEVKIICFNNFYKNPNEIRSYLLNQHFNFDKENNIFSYTSSSCLNKSLIILKKIMNKDIVIDSNDFIINFKNENITHNINNNNWTAIIFLSPMSRICSGIKFYKLENNSNFILEDEIGNIFNRMVIFKSKFYNSIGGFGNNINDGNLYQRIIFSINNV